MVQYVVSVSCPLFMVALSPSDGDAKSISLALLQYNILMFMYESLSESLSALGFFLRYPPSSMKEELSRFSL